MLKRIVKLTFKAENIEAFQEIFKERGDRIAESPGCRSVELLQDQNDPRIFFTFSLWDSEEDLNNYRKSPLFGDTWKKTKALFDDKPQAWSTTSIAHKTAE